jgi:hypothetical protein
VRAYKGIGLVTLSAILIGLIAFLAVNLFYLFDRTWIRPVILSPTHEQVITAHRHVVEMSIQRDTLEGELETLGARKEALSRTVAANRAFEEEFKEVFVAGASAISPAAVSARRDYDLAALERQEAEGALTVVDRDITRRQQNLKRTQRLVDQIASTPYIAALDGPVTVAFAPYENLPNANAGADIYACRLGLIWCSHVGEVVETVDGEVTNSHPQTGKTLRGRILTIRLYDLDAAQEQALFLDKRPLWIF